MTQNNSEILWQDQRRHKELFDFLGHDYFEKPFYKSSECSNSSDCSFIIPSLSTEKFKDSISTENIDNSINRLRQDKIFYENDLVPLNNLMNDTEISKRKSFRVIEYKNQDNKKCKTILSNAHYTDKDDSYFKSSGFHEDEKKRATFQNLQSFSWLNSINLRKKVTDIIYNQNNSKVVNIVSFENSKLNSNSTNEFI